MRKTQTEIPEDVKSTLCNGSFKSTDPLHYVLPPSLDRSLYVRCNEVLTRYGAKWKKGKIAAHVFDDEYSKSEFESAIESGEMKQRNAESFYPTPYEVGHVICDAVATITNFSVINRHETFILEPSAGDGALAKVIREFWPQATLVGVEINRERATQATKYFDLLLCADFIERPITDQVDMVIMNPPFTTINDSKAWIAHITKAWNLLCEGGVLAAVVPATFESSTIDSVLRLKKLLGVWDIIHIDEHAFKDSGTLAHCDVIIARNVEP